MDFVEGTWREVCHKMSQKPLLSLGKGGNPLKSTIPEASQGQLCKQPFLRRAVSGLPFLRSYDGDSEDAPSHSSCSFNDCSLGDVNCNVPLHALTSRSPGEVSPEDPLSPNIPVLVLPAAGWDPASLEASDVGLQPVGTSSLEAQRRAARLPRPPADSRMMEEDRAPPRLADTHRAEPECPGRHPGSGLRTGGPKLSFSKRKLELLLAEPERNKKKKQYGA